ncbi:MAG: hypothetical protein IKU04_05435 [Bacteroidales bacterium]|nr:hypothetical protein [Bacteroidales bacterium]
MTDKEKEILHRLFNKSVIDMLAEQRPCDEGFVCAQLVDSLAENQQLHSELGLVHRPWISFRAVKEALARNGVPTFRTSLYVSMPIIRILREDSRVTIEREIFGNAAFLRCISRSIRLNLAGNSLAKLMLFFNAVLPEAVHMVQERAKEIQKRDAMFAIAKTSISALLDAQGRKYRFVKYLDSIGAEILLPPNRVLHIEYTAYNAAEKAMHLEETLTAVDAGREPDMGYLRQLTRNDGWAQ